MPITTLNLENAASDASVRRALASVSSTLVKSRRIVVVTGAGISCSCGIPDFRSSDGLYNLVKQQYPDVVMKGRDLFDASLFRDPTSTAVFYTFIAGLKAAVDNAQPSPTHHFLHTLHKRGKLLRSYTQNIDGLEERSGLTGSSVIPTQAQAKEKGAGKIGKDVKNIQLHGDIHRVRCTVCSASYPCEPAHSEMFKKGTSPECPECKERCDERVARSARAVRVGTLRPAIVLYDEPHPLGDDIATVQTSDLAKRPDLLIIMGTSLKVHGLKKLVKEFAKAVHHGSSVASSANAASKVIFVNKTPPAGEWAGVIDVHIEGTTDDWVDRVSKDWKKTRPADWEIQTTLKDVTAIKNIKSTTKPVDVNGKPAKAKLKVPKKNKSDEENIPPSKPQGKTTSSQEPALEKGLPSADFTFSMKTPLSAKTSATPAISKPMKKVVSAKMTAQIKRPATPLAGISNKPTTPPLSPSKRQNLESHYEDRKGELQPRKRPRSVDGSLDRVFGTSKENGVADENDGENQIVLPLVC